MKILKPIILPIYLIISLLVTCVLGLGAADTTAQSRLAAPTDADIFRYHAFLEPLVPIGGKTTPEENIAPSKAIDSCLQRKDRDGSKWVCNWVAYVEDDARSPGLTAFLWWHSPGKTVPPLSLETSAVR